MKCPNCYNEIPADSKFCPDCGRKVEKIQTNDNQVFNIKGISFKMIRVEHGAFTMCKEISYDAHLVTLTNDYYIGEILVTQALWEAIMGSNPSYFKGHNLPVECVSWNDCQEFIQKLNSETGRKFRLPTEAEWEFAARGGIKSNRTEYSGSTNIDDVAWYGGNSENKPHPVKTKKPNELGIYDMSGNVWEWCQDWGDSYCISLWGSQTNPKGSTSGSFRVIRGGCWCDSARNNCSLSCRSIFYPVNSYFNIGFRLALSE